MVSTNDGKKSERSYPFIKRIDLPIIEKDSIKLNPDSYGNLIWTWNIPQELGQLSVNHRTRLRAAIDIYNKNQNIAYFSVILPSHMSYVFIPREIVQKLNSKGDRFEFKVQLETRDKNNRTYSKPYIINDRLL